MNNYEIAPSVTYFLAKERSNRKIHEMKKKASKYLNLRMRS